MELKEKIVKLLSSPEADDKLYTINGCEILTGQIIQAFARWLREKADEITKPDHILGLIAQDTCMSDEDIRIHNILCGMANELEEPCEKKD